MKREVSHVKCHQALFAPGVGNLENTLSWTHHRGIKMYYTAEGVEVAYKGVNFIIPLGNVACSTFAPVEAPKKVAKLTATEESPAA